MIEWRILYDDGTDFDSSQGEPCDAPAYGIVCIIQRDDLVGRKIAHGWDWYYWVPQEGAWWGADIYGLLDRLLHRLPTEAICQGRMVSNKEFAIIMGRADRDPDFPKKSGKIVGETPYGS
jgi:hypothetical protein